MKTFHNPSPTTPTQHFRLLCNFNTVLWFKDKLEWKHNICIEIQTQERIFIFLFLCWKNNGTAKLSNYIKIFLYVVHT